MVLENRKTGKFKSLVQREELLQGAALIQGTHLSDLGALTPIFWFGEFHRDLFESTNPHIPCSGAVLSVVQRGPLPLEQAKTAPEKDNPGPLKSSFTGFLHFATDRTLSGWELLCRMVKHTSKEFLCGREHVRVFECREIRSKTGSKTGLKRGPSRCPKHRKHRYTGKYSNGRTPKKESKIEPKTTLKLCTNQLKNGNRLTTLCLTEAYYCLPGKCCAKYGNGEYRQQVYDLTGDADGECLGQ